MQGCLLLQAFFLSIISRSAETALAAVATVPPNVQPQQNLTINTPLVLLDAPSNQVHKTWPVDSTHTLKFTQYAIASPERDYFAALISTQTAIFAAYLSGPSPLLHEDEVEYSFYGVKIEFGNYEMALTYAIVSKILGAVGAFLQRWKMCEATWTLIEKGETDPIGRVISVGMIQRDRKGVLNTTVMNTALGAGTS